MMRRDTPSMRMWRPMADGWPLKCWRQIAVAEDDVVVAAGDRIFAGEEAAGGGMNAQRVKGIHGDVCAEDAIGTAGTGQI